jgi:hypothetical protein
MRMGLRDAARYSAKAILAENKSILLVPGGATEALCAFGYCATSSIRCGTHISMLLFVLQTRTRTPTCCTCASDRASSSLPWRPEPTSSRSSALEVRRAHALRPVLLLAGCKLFTVPVCVCVPAAETDTFAQLSTDYAVSPRMLLLLPSALLTISIPCIPGAGGAMGQAHVPVLERVLAATHQVSCPSTAADSRSKALCAVPLLIAGCRPRVCLAATSFPASAR